MLTFILLWCSTHAAASGQRASAASDEQLAQAEASASRQFLQPRNRAAGTRVLADTVGMQYFAWAAPAFDDCCTTPGGSFMMRTMVCKDVFSGATAPENACDSARKPALAMSCQCGDDSPCFADCHGEPGSMVSDWNSDPEEIGCILKSKVSRQLGLLSTEVYGSATECGKFCFARGLDVFGNSGESCYCGASKANMVAFHSNQTAADRHAFEQGALLESCGEESVRVSRYTGFYESGGMPLPYFHGMRVQDLMHIESITQERCITDAMEEDGKANQLDQSIIGRSIKNGAYVREFQAPNWERTCYPENCGPGRGPFDKTYQDEKPHGDSKPFGAYVMIKYLFDPPSLDNTRKNAFREAARRVRQQTCINLMEVTEEPDVKVGNYDSRSCYLAGMGKSPYDNNPSLINLGWCNSNFHIGSMVHEIGHLIGMNHEQKRPDGAQSYHGQGPFLNMHWQSISSSWVPQYTPDYASYIGSNDQGPGDSVVGYAPYDFGSIMHYSASNAFDTNPASAVTEVGNRAALSPGDVSQVMDMYQCEAPTTTPLPPSELGWTVLQGPCTVVAPSCVQSDNYPNSYALDVQCRIRADVEEGQIIDPETSSFSTEARYDTLKIGGNIYSGTDMSFTSLTTQELTSSVIEWFSDYSIVRSGWKLCLTPSDGSTTATTTTMSTTTIASTTISMTTTTMTTLTTTSSMTTATTTATTITSTTTTITTNTTTTTNTATTTPAPTTTGTNTTTTSGGGTGTQPFAVLTGSCTVEGRCVISPNYPGEYSPSQDCTIRVSNDIAVGIDPQTFEFDTQRWRDKLRVLGTRFHGTRAQAIRRGILDFTAAQLAGAEITWASDDDALVGAGWKMCILTAP